MERKYNINKVIKSLELVDHESAVEAQEILCVIVDILTKKLKESQDEMDYEERLSHNWNDYESAKAVRNFCQSFLNDLGIR